MYEKSTVTKFGATFEWLYNARRGTHSLIMPKAVYQILPLGVSEEVTVTGADDLRYFDPVRYADVAAAKDAIMEEYGHVYA